MLHDENETLFDRGRCGGGVVYTAQNKDRSFDPGAPQGRGLANTDDRQMVTAGAKQSPTHRDGTVAVGVGLYHRDHHSAPCPALCRGKIGANRVEVNYSDCGATGRQGHPPLRGHARRVPRYRKIGLPRRGFQKRATTRRLTPDAPLR